MIETLSDYDVLTEDMIVTCECGVSAPAIDMHRVNADLDALDWLCPPCYVEYLVEG